MKEFDALSEGYHAGFDDPLKALVGTSARDFLAPKAHLLFDEITRRFGESRSLGLRMLDFGCGSADFLIELIESGCDWELEGCDVSSGMLSEARRRHGAKLQRARIWHSDGEALPRQVYDIVTAVCVFHHIEPSAWRKNALQIFESLVGGGTFLLFEHNPLNPVTRWMVSRTEVDRNAHLLRPAISRTLLRDAGFKNISTCYFLFFPPRVKFLRPCERFLRRIPLGGQYLVVAQKN